MFALVEKPYFLPSEMFNMIMVINKAKICKIHKYGHLTLTSIITEIIQMEFFVKCHILFHKKTKNNEATSDLSLTITG